MVFLKNNLPKKPLSCIIYNERHNEDILPLKEGLRGSIVDMKRKQI